MEITILIQDIHNSHVRQGKGFSLPIIFICIWDSKWYLICALVDSHRFQGSATRSLLQSTCQSFRTTKLQPLAFLAFVIFWCPAWVHMMSDCQTAHILGLLPRFDTLPLHCRYPYPPFPWSAWWRHGIRRINSSWQMFKSWINFL